MRKPDFCICINKGTDQLCSYSVADQHFCFRYKDGTFTLLSKSEISSLSLYSVHICTAWFVWTWLKTLKIGFVMMRLKCNVFVT